MLRRAATERNILGSCKNGKLLKQNIIGNEPTVSEEGREKYYCGSWSNGGKFLSGTSWLPRQPLGLSQVYK